MEMLYAKHRDTLFHVGKILNRSLVLQETLNSVLAALHEHAGVKRGIVALNDQENSGLRIQAIHSDSDDVPATAHYQPGEGLLGAIMDQASPLIVERIESEPRFVDKLGLYYPELPFVGVPIRIDEYTIVGVLAAQPRINSISELPEQARLMEMTAELIAQSVTLSREVEAEKRDLRDERDLLRQTVRKRYGFENIVGQTQVMKRVFELVRQVAKWNSTVLVRGESGTGKELIANAIHYNSPRVSAPIVKVNCAALPDNLLESELFGHEKGAFTGAVNQRKGRFEQAHGGTIFLDEIGEISPTFQAKLLRVLQEGEFERVGGSKTLKVDVRVIAATNRDLESEVAEGAFREDLYYRLNVMPIYLPSLRERPEDIPTLSGFLLNKIAKSQGRELKISDNAIRALMRHTWPGNVRELENCLERAAIMSESGEIDSDSIAATGMDGMFATSSTGSVDAVDLNDESLSDRERVIAALEQAGWVQAKAARLLNMTPRQIAYRVQTLDIKMKQF